MKPGRKNKPTALKLISNNPGNRPLPVNEPKPSRAFSPRAPRGFSAAERAKWHDTCKRLSAMRVLTIVDLDALEIYVRNWVAMQEALADLAARGKVLRSPSGSVMWNPSWTQYKHSERVCRSLQAEFGMTPSSRTSVVANADDSGKSTWADF